MSECAERERCCLSRVRASLVRKLTKEAGSDDSCAV